MIADEPTREGVLAAWRVRAAGAPARSPLAAERPRRDVDGRDERAALSFPLPESVRRFARGRKVDDDPVLLAAFAATLHRYSDETDLLLALQTPAGFGLARIDLDGAPSFDELVRRTRDAASAAASAPCVTPEDLTEPSGGAALPAHAAFAVASASTTGVPRAIPWDLALTAVIGHDGATSLRFDYCAAAFDGATIERLAAHFTLLLRGALNEPGRPIATLPLLTGAELELQRDWNATETPYRRDADLVDLLREQALRTPDAVAVEFDGATVTYAELDRRANALGSYLRDRGVGDEALVAILLERSIEMIVAVLGVHRAGGAYVPIDPGYPLERVDFMLSDSGVSVILTQEALRASLPPCDAAIVSLDGDRAAISAASTSPPAPASNPGRLAYVIYTSGSTGRPKGVQIEHRNVVNFLAGMAARIAIGAGDTLVALAPLAFDISGLDIYFSLTSGARIVVAPRETAVNPRALIALIASSGATFVQATPSTWRMVVEAGWEGVPELTILCGGEALPQPLADQLVSRAAAVWNLYGPTEATIWATMDRVVAGAPVSIGRPMANVATYVVDADLQRLPYGMRGELFIAGDGLARGYLNRPELTAERFLPDPYGPPGARMYRTGDLARFRADGCVEFLGRADFQVKLRGYRIELGEIEAALESRPEVLAAVAVVRDNAAGEQSLVAYVTTDAGAGFSSGAVRTALRERLPAYMIPDAIVVLDAMPLNTNGKIDRARLPAPVFERAVRDEGARVAPRTALETQLTTIWEDVLGINAIGVTDDFFELGATSIVAARLFDRIERDLGATLPLSPLFQAPTIERLATLIEGSSAAATPGNVAERSLTSLVAVQPLGTQPPIFCVHGGAGTILHFQALAQRLGDDQPFYGLQLQGLYGDAPPHVSIEQMATHYLHEVRTVQSAGPYRLAGYCFGAIVAVEMARQLQARGEQVTLIANFNGPAPAYIARYGNTPRKPRAPGPPRRWSAAQRVRAQFTKKKFMQRTLPLRRAVRRGLLFVGTRLCARLGRPLPEPWRAAAIYELCAVAELRYRPPAVSGVPMLLFYGAGLFRSADLGWAPFFGEEVTSYEVPGDHETQRDVMHEPNVGFVAERVRETLARTAG